MITIDNRLMKAFEGLYDTFFIPGEGLFREAVGTTKREENPFSYNWSFGALLSAYAALLESGAADKSALREQWAEQLKEANDRYLTFASGMMGYDSYVDQEKPDRYYDDNAWIGLASLRIYECTWDPRWMQSAMTAYGFVRSGADEKTGGVWWRENPKESQHVCSTGPAGLLAAHVYRYTDQDEALAFADRCLRWTLTLRDPNGVFQDHVNLKTGKVAPQKYTYNQGTPLHAAAELHHLTGEAFYRDAARNILRAVDYIVSGDDVIEREAAGQLPRTPWFNAVLLRGLNAAEEFIGETSPLYVVYGQELEAAWDRWDGERPLIVRQRADNPVGRVSLLDAGGTYEMAALLAVRER